MNEVKEFVKKPVTIKAMQFRPSDPDWDWNALTKFFGSRSGDGNWQSMGYRIMIVTLEGNMYANEGDWIIKGVAGEFYPCNPFIFEQTYSEKEKSGKTV